MQRIIQRNRGGGDESTAEMNQLQCITGQHWPRDEKIDIFWHLFSRSFVCYSLPPPLCFCLFCCCCCTFRCPYYYSYCYLSSLFFFWDTQEKGERGKDKSMISFGKAYNDFFTFLFCFALFVPVWLACAR